MVGNRESQVGDGGQGDRDPVEVDVERGTESGFSRGHNRCGVTGQGHNDGNSCITILKDARRERRTGRSKTRGNDGVRGTAESPRKRDILTGP